MQIAGGLLVAVLASLWLPPAGALALSRLFPGMDGRVVPLVGGLWMIQLVAGAAWLPDTTPVPRPLVVAVLANAVAAMVLLAFIMRVETAVPLLAAAHRLGYTLAVFALGAGPAVALGLFKGVTPGALLGAVLLAAAWCVVLQVLWPHMTPIDWPEDHGKAARVFAVLPWTFVLGMLGLVVAVLTRPRG